MSESKPMDQPITNDASLEKNLTDLKIGDGNAQSSPNEKTSTPNVDTTQASSTAASVQNIPPGPLKTPILHPLDGCIPAAAPVLTAEQQTKYEKVLEAVKGWKDIPSGNDTGGPITDKEIFWLTRECLLRPCHYLNPGRQNTDPSPRQIQHVVFMLEQVLELAPPGQETLALLINFKTSKSRSNTAPGISTGREVLHILQTHYPERMGRALIINVPWVVWGFFKLITPFIDPITKEKLHFNEDMRKHVPPQQLWTEFQGELEFEYEHDVYWPALLKLTAERRAQRWERWVNAGKQYGESETYLKGGDVPSTILINTDDTGPVYGLPNEMASSQPAKPPLGIQSQAPRGPQSGLRYPSSGKTIYHRPLNRTKTAELSQASFAYLFGEMVSYAQRRVTGIQDLEKRLNVQGHPIGLKLLDLLLYREPPRTQTRPLHIIALLQFITTVLWKHLFSRPADALEKSSNPETPDEYMISDNEPLVNQYISVPREMNQLNCAAFVAGIIEGVCDGAGFPARVTAHSVGKGEEGELWPGKTVFLVKFQPEVVEREAYLGSN
ncbi:putative CRAL-TRIO domain-containing protein C23B6.04c [Xylogone sp. PMI_703]|nr:putative CRAL-TRIO domain-containing protein C23B6.04c [Xylogone sp. PMI_703]